MAAYETSTLNVFDPDIIEYRLGKNGPGFVIVEDSIPDYTLALIEKELSEPDVPWMTATSTNTNSDGEPVEQVFEVFAHKYSHGNQERLDVMPKFRGLAGLALKNVIKPLSLSFSSLERWTPDEIVAQRYPESDGGLGWHRDLKRHPGVIITYSTEGERLLSVRHGGTETHHELHPGFLTIMRATGLYKPRFLSMDRIDNQHRVSSPKGEKGSVSVTLRANNKPNEPTPNFPHYNWIP